MTSHEVQNSYMTKTTGGFVMWLILMLYSIVLHALTQALDNLNLFHWGGGGGGGRWAQELSDAIN